MSEQVEELRAALAVAELEAELAAAKAGGLDGDEYTELKQRVREARREFRERRAGGPVADGAAVVSPEPVAVSAEAKL